MAATGILVKRVKAEIGALAFASLLVTACSPAPERVCEHYVGLVEKQFGPIDATSPKPRADAVQRCVRERTAMLRAEKKRYDCWSSCTMDKGHLMEVSDCDQTCK